MHGRTQNKAERQSWHPLGLRMQAGRDLKTAHRKPCQSPLHAGGLTEECGPSSDGRRGARKQIHEQTARWQWLHTRGRAGKGGLKDPGSGGMRTRQGQGRPRCRNDGRRGSGKRRSGATTLHGAGVVTAGAGRGRDHGRHRGIRRRRGGKKFHLTGTGTIRRGRGN